MVQAGVHGHSTDYSPLRASAAAGAGLHEVAESVISAEVWLLADAAWADCWVGMDLLLLLLLPLVLISAWIRLKAHICFLQYDTDANHSVYCSSDSTPNVLVVTFEDLLLIVCWGQQDTGHTVER
jgi:hypothetical protein